MSTFHRRTVAVWLALSVMAAMPAFGCTANTDADSAGSDEAAIASGAALRESSLAFEVKLRGSSPVQIHARVWRGCGAACAA